MDHELIGSIHPSTNNFWLACPTTEIKWERKNCGCIFLRLYFFYNLPPHAPTRFRLRIWNWDLKEMWNNWIRLWFDWNQSRKSCKAGWTYISLFHKISIWISTPQGESSTVRCQKKIRKFSVRESTYVPKVIFY